MESTLEFVAKKYFLSHTTEFDEHCKFVKFEVSPCRTDGRNSMALVGRILYERAGATLRSEEFFVKVTSPQMLFPDQETFQFTNEVHFYTKILPFFRTFRGDDLVPKFYASCLDVSDEWTHDVILLENLEASGFSRRRQKPFLDRDHIALMMRKIGEFHAYSFKAKQEHAERFFSIVGVGSHVRLARTSLLPAREQRWKRDLAPLQNREEYSEAATNLVKTMKNYDLVLNYRNCGPEYDTAVLGHCAFDSCNVLFRYDENGKPVDLKLVDWQTWKLASAAMDVLTPLYIDASQRTRDEHWDDFIETYYSSLRDTFPEVQVPKKESLVSEFALYVPPILFMAGYRFPCPNFSANDELLTYTSSLADATSDPEAFVDPLVDMFKDMVKRGYL